MTLDLEFVDPGHISTIFISNITLTEDLTLIYADPNGQNVDLTFGYEHHLCAEYLRIFGTERFIAQVQGYELTSVTDVAYGAVALVNPNDGRRVQVAVQDASCERVSEWVQTVLGTETFGSVQH